MTTKEEPVEETPDTLPRETGSEKSGRDCEECGSELPAVTTVYGSSVVGVCPKCEKGSDQLKAQRAAAREKEAVL